MEYDVSDNIIFNFNFLNEFILNKKKFKNSVKFLPYQFNGNEELNVKITSSNPGDYTSYNGKKLVKNLKYLYELLDELIEVLSYLFSDKSDAFDSGCLKLLNYLKKTDDRIKQNFHCLIKGKEKNKLINLYIIK